MPDLHHHLKPYHNKYENQTVAIFAPGPSINKFDVKLDKTIYRAAINAVIVHEEHRDLDFFFWGGDLDLPCHPTPSEHYVREHLKFLPNKTLKFTDSQNDYEEFYPPFKQRVHITTKEAQALGFNCLSQGLKITNGKDIWFKDVSENPVDSFSTIFQAIQILLYMGFRKIILIGADCGGMHSYKSLVKVDKTDWNPKILFKELISHWKKFKKWVNKNYPSVEIESINPVGLIDVFPLYKS